MHKTKGRIQRANLGEYCIIEKAVDRTREFYFGRGRLEAMAREEGVLRPGEAMA